MESLHLFDFLRLAPVRAPTQPAQFLWLPKRISKVFELFEGRRRYRKMISVHSP